MKKLIYSSLLAMLLVTFCQKSANAQGDEKIYSFIAIKDVPSYPGGFAAFYKFLSANIKYPEMAAKNNVQGQVLVSFVVEKDGSLTDIKTEKSLGSGTDEEAIRVLKLAEKWNPGMLEGKAVRVKYNIPIKFALVGKSPKPSTATTSQTSTSPLTNDNKVYNFVSMENPARYPDGMAAFYKFLAENVKYPKEAKDNKIEGKVLVSFVVDTDGSLTDIQVMRKIGYGTDEEAVRVLKLSKKWNPGLVDGNPVKVKYNVPVSFALAK